MNILLGVTGSVASTLTPKLVRAFKEAFGKVEVVASANSIPFFNKRDIPEGVPIWQEVDEWTWDDEEPHGEHTPYYDGGFVGRGEYKKDDSVLHIELRKRCSAFVVAPISANKLAEFAYGMSYDLMGSVALAWDYCRPVIVAPAMNTYMWRNPAVQENLEKLKSRGVIVVPPVSKLLACGDTGEGGLADIKDIVSAVKEQLRWRFPLELDANFTGIPVSHHPGAFGFHRKHSHHTGVDLYCDDHAKVHAVETGRVVNIEHFTGEWDNSPWWNETDCVLVEGPSGVVCYGEVMPRPLLTRGDIVKQGQHIAFVRRVLKDGKERPDIPGHKTAMLHFELYPHGTTTASKSWQIEPQGENCHRPDDLLDPTPMLIAAINAPETRHSM